MSNRLLRPLQLVKADLEEEASIAGIYMLEEQTLEERFGDSLYELEKAVEAELARQAREKATELDRQKQPNETKGNTEGIYEVRESASAPVVKPKPIADVSVASVYSKVSRDVYLESEDAIDRFIEALRNELKSHINQDKRVRIK